MALVSIVLATLLLACCAVAWVSRSTRVDLREARARIEEAMMAAANSPHDATGWAS